ncbi:MAG: exosortase/archaeosortase family protein [Candidatus Thermoplasmatota archaeon]
MPIPPTASTQSPAKPAGAAGSSGQAYIGLALLGWGLAILLGVTPHEDYAVGAALTAFGAVLVATAASLPRLPRVPALLVAGGGLALAATVLAYVLAAHAVVDARKLALILLGCGLVIASPWLHRSVRLPRRGATTTVGSLAGCALVVLGAPLAVWAVQAAFKAAVGATPVEAFVRVALLGPLHVILSGLGLGSSVDGQTVTYATRHGTLLVDVGAACSGLQAMALFSGVLALYLIVERPGGRRLALWSLIGVAGVYVANLLRLVTIFLVGYRWGADALVQVHAQAGWIFFVAWALLFARLVPKSRRAR